MIDVGVQPLSQAMLSLFVPSIAISVIGAFLLAVVRLFRPKKPKYKPLPGPKGQYSSSEEKVLADSAIKVYHGSALSTSFPPRMCTRSSLNGYGPYRGF